MHLLLLGTAWANLFGPNDHDGDGVNDKDDVCMHRKEVKNGFEDEDGCPDSLSAVEVAVFIDGNLARNAPLSVMIGDEVRTATGSLQARDLFPGTRVRAFSKVGCLDGEADLTMKDAARRVRLNLVPHTKAVTVLVRDLVTEEPGRARVRWDSLRGCGPQGPMRLQGEKVIILGVGDHTVGLGRAGREPFNFTVTPDTDFVVIPASSVQGMKRRAGKTLDPIVYFGSNRANLDTAALAQVEQMHQWLIAHPDAKVRIEGHTDERATNGYNLDLSQRRAQAVHAALVQRGIAAERLKVAAQGEDLPAEMGWDEATMAKNRRVVFYEL